MFSFSTNHSFQISNKEIERNCKEVFEINNERFKTFYENVVNPYGNGIFHSDKDKDKDTNNNMKKYSDGKHEHKHEHNTTIITNRKQKQKQIQKSKSKPTVQEWYYVKETDTLFWHLYILTKGMDQYMFHKNKIQLKNDTIFEWVDLLQKSTLELKPVYRPQKLKIDDIINDLASSKTIEMTTFIGVAIALKLPLVITQKKCAYIFPVREDSQLTEQSSDSTLFYHYNSDTRNMKYEKVELSNIKSQYIIGKYWGKPFLSKSAYKLSELHGYATILGIETKTLEGKNKKKDQLWDEMMEVI